MKKLLRLLPPIIAIILVVVVTLVLVNTFPNKLDESMRNEDGYYSDPYDLIQTKITSSLGQIVFATGGFISLLISIKWLFDSIYAIKNN